MKYFKNTELAKLYNISEKSVRNWIEAAQTGKLDLQLFEHNDKFYIANTSKNMANIEKLVEKGKKYKNSRGLKTITPTDKFYETFNQKQILDIIANLTVHREIPLHYTYVDGGAEYWDKYANRLLHEETPNMLNQTITLVDQSLENIDRLLDKDKKINVVDLGPGNALPIRNTLTYLLKHKKLGRYVAIDISQEMLSIAERNIREWFGDAVQFEGHVRDLSHERFDDLFADDYATDDADTPVNLVVLLGGSLSNFRSPLQALQAINNSLSPHDLFVFGSKLDTPNTRRFFDFNISSHNEKLTPRHKLLLDFLQIEEPFYDVEQLFDEVASARFIRILPKVDISINFKMAKGIRSIELRKHEPILLWRFWHMSAMETINQFDKSGFDIMHATRTSDKDYLLMVSKIKIKVDQ